MSDNSTHTPHKNLGTHRIPNLPMSKFPTADEIVYNDRLAMTPEKRTVDVLLVNPPTPDGSLYIRSQHRVGRKTRENMIWPQVSLAQLAAMLHPTYKVKIIDANAERLSWEAFTHLLDQYLPSYYLTQVTAPTLENDMYGCFLAKARGARTIAFGTHVTPIPRETLRPFPSLDYVLVGEPELTLVDLIDHLEGKVDQRSAPIEKLFTNHDPMYHPSFKEDGEPDLYGIKGLAWRDGEEMIVNPQRPFIANLDDLPMPMHELLPLDRYRMPMIKGPFTFIVTSRGCPAGCAFCIKHVTYQFATRLRSPELIIEELKKLGALGVHNIHMYADLFTVNRDQVMELCQRIIDEKLNIKWMCNSRVDYVDEEMLQMMGKAGNWLISWGIESGNEKILKRTRKGTNLEKVRTALGWAKKAGIMNWGYFIIGLPGETEETIQQTIKFAKGLPLDIALFHVAAPHPGTPFFFEVAKNGWFRPGTRWEQVDMDQVTVLDYPHLSAERLLYWQKRAWREWAFRPGPMFTYLKMLTSDWSTLKSAMNVGLQHLTWSTSESEIGGESRLTHFYLELGNPMRREPILIIFLFLAVVTRVGSAVYLGDRVVELPGTADQISYHTLAVRVVEGHGFTFGEDWWPATKADAPTAHWSYLYTLYLVAIYKIFGVHPLAARILQAILVGILQPYLSYAIGKYLFGRKIGLIAAALSAGYLYFIYYAATLMTEPFYITGILGSIYLALLLGQPEKNLTSSTSSKQWYGRVILFGVTMGITILLRQLFMIAAPVFYLWLWLANRSRKGYKIIPLTLISLALIIGMVLPFTIYNYQRFGSFVLLNTNSGYAFFLANHPAQGTSFIDARDMENYGDLLPRELLYLDEAALDKELLKRGFQFVIEDPVRYALLSMSRIKAYFVFWPLKASGLLSNITRVGSFGILLPFMLGGLGIWFQERRKDGIWQLLGSPGMLLIFFTLMYTGIHLLTWALIRYRLPVDAILLPFAALSLGKLLFFVTDRFLKPVKFETN